MFLTLKVRINKQITQSVKGHHWQWGQWGLKIVSKSWTEILGSVFCWFGVFSIIFKGWKEFFLHKTCSCKDYPNILFSYTFNQNINSAEIRLSATLCVSFSSPLRSGALDRWINKVFGIFLGFRNFLPLQHLKLIPLYHFLFFMIKIKHIWHRF